MANQNQTKLSKVTNAWQLYANPLARLTQWEIKRLINSLRFGNDIRLQIAFYDIERLCPLFGICIDKRQAGLLKRKWKILPLEESDAAKAQAEEVEKAFRKSDTRNRDGLTAAIQALSLGAFRGRSCVKPYIQDGELMFAPVQNWNTLYYNGRLYWNPTASEEYCFSNGVPQQLQELTEDEVCWLNYDRPIDLPGLDVYLKLMIGEDNYARAVEKYGIPPIVVVPPEGTSDTLLDEWTSRAIALFEGGSGCMPAGTDIKVMSEARGQDPFSSYIQHQMELIVLLALGQKMTSLGEAAGIGSGLADVQQGEFNNLVTRDAKMIQNTLSRCAVKKVVKQLLKEKEVLCKFEFVEDEDTTAAEYIEMATKLNSLGAVIDLQELKKLTNLSFIKDDVKDLWTPKN